MADTSHVKGEVEVKLESPHDNVSSPTAKKTEKRLEKTASCVLGSVFHTQNVDTVKGELDVIKSPKVPASNHEKFNYHTRGCKLELKVTRCEWLRCLGDFINFKGVLDIVLIWLVPPMLHSPNPTLFTLLNELSQISTPIRSFSIEIEGLDINEVFFPNGSIISGDNPANTALIDWHRFLLNQYENLQELCFKCNCGVETVVDLINHLPASVKHLDISSNCCDSDQFLYMLLYRITTSISLERLVLKNVPLHPLRRFTLMDGLKQLGLFSYLEDIKAFDLLNLELLPPRSNEPLEYSISKEFLDVCETDVLNDEFVLSKNTSTAVAPFQAALYHNSFARLLLSGEGILQQEPLTNKRVRKMSSRFSHGRMRSEAILRGEKEVNLYDSINGNLKCPRALSDLFPYQVAYKVMESKLVNRNHFKAVVDFLANRICAKMLPYMSTRVWWEPSNDVARDVHCARFWKSKVIRSLPEEQTAMVSYKSLPSETVFYKFLQPGPTRVSGITHTCNNHIKKKSPLTATLELSSPSTHKIHVNESTTIMNVGINMLINASDESPQQLNISPPKGATELTLRFSNSVEDSISEYMLCTTPSSEGRSSECKVVQPFVTPSKYRPLWTGEWVEFNWDGEDSNEFVGVVLAKCPDVDEYIIGMPWHENDNVTVIPASSLRPVLVAPLKDWFTTLMTRGKSKLLSLTAKRLIPQGVLDNCTPGCPYEHNIESSNLHGILINALLLSNMSTYKRDLDIESMKVAIPFQFSAEAIEGLSKDVVKDADLFDESPLSVALLELTEDVLQSYKEPRKPVDFDLMNYRTYCLARTLSLQGGSTYTSVVEYDMNKQIRSILSWDCGEFGPKKLITQKPIEVSSVDDAISVGLWDTLLDLQERADQNNARMCKCNRKRNILCLPCHHLSRSCSACFVVDKSDTCVICNLVIERMIEVL